MMHRREVSITCIHKFKLEENKVKESGNTKYNLWSTCKDMNRISVGKV